MPYMYILACADGTYYTGSTQDLKLRMQQHYLGKGGAYTRDRMPVKLIYYEKFDSIADAYAREKQIQGWSHKKKSALIRGDMQKLIELSKSKSGLDEKD